MKNCKILIIIVILLAGSTVHFYLKYKKYFAAFNECGQTATTCNYENLNLITEETADSLTKNYKTDLDNTLGIRNKRYFEIDKYGDSRSVWFSYSDLTNYLCLIKKQYKEVDGVRIYFGRYPDLRSLHQLHETTNMGDGMIRDLVEVPKEYSFRHCLFFVPTFSKKGESKNSDFILEKKEDAAGPVSNILLLGNQENHGGLAPPSRAEGATYLRDEQ